MRSCPETMAGIGGITRIYDFEPSERSNSTCSPTVGLPVIRRRYLVPVHTRRLEFEGVENFRDLGGYPTADGGQLLRDLYIGMLLHSAPLFGVLLTGFVEPTNRPAVFHCHAGKDRTGIAAALLLLAVGVDRETILDDYELTRRYRTPDHQQ